MFLQREPKALWEQHTRCSRLIKGIVRLKVKVARGREVWDPEFLESGQVTVGCESVITMLFLLRELILSGILSHGQKMTDNILYPFML
jgi:hypothetical protein